jgi:hypothetical protein
MVAAIAFFLLLCNCSATPQRRRRHLPLPFSPCCAVVAQLHKEGDNSCRRLLLPAVELRYNAIPRRTVTFFFLLWSCVTAQQKKATMLWSCIAVAFFFLF